MTRRLLVGLMMAALVAFSALAIACGDDDDDDAGGDENGGDAAEQQELADLAEQLATIDGATATQEDIDFFFEHITDGFVQAFGTESIEVCMEDAPSCIGDPLPNATASSDDVDIDGDSAEVVIGSDFGPFGLAFVREGEVWKADGLFVPDDEIAEGTDVVDMSLLDFAFDFDADALASGDFALHVTNDGAQPHEIILVALPAEGTIEELLQDDSFEPEPIFVKTPYAPGDESDVALPAALEAGRYGFVCFLPDTEDPEGTPHAFKGMTAEFTVE